MIIFTLKMLYYSNSVCESHEMYKNLMYISF